MPLPMSYLTVVAQTCHAIANVVSNSCGSSYVYRYVRRARKAHPELSYTKADIDRHTMRCLEVARKAVRGHALGHGIRTAELVCAWKLLKSMSRAGLCLLPCVCGGGSLGGTKRGGEKSCVVRTSSSNACVRVVGSRAH
jgi:hypothetical protein